LANMYFSSIFLLVYIICFSQYFRFLFTRHKKKHLIQSFFISNFYQFKIIFVELFELNVWRVGAPLIKKCLILIPNHTRLTY
jgi:hypothetical protein